MKDDLSLLKNNHNQPGFLEFNNEIIKINKKT